jgi:hypothetical protein
VIAQNWVVLMNGEREELFEAIRQATKIAKKDPALISALKVIKDCANSLCGTTYYAAKTLDEIEFHWEEAVGVKTAEVERELREVYEILNDAEHALHDVEIHRYHAPCSPRLQSDIDELRELGGVVYFVRRLSDEAIKVGKSRRLDERLKAHKRKYGEITLLGTLPGYTELERLMHRRFWDEAVNEEREWFKGQEIEGFVVSELAAR